MKDKTTTIPVPSSFTLLKSEYVAAVSAAVSLLKHNQTGASLLHLHTDDPHRVFAVSFRTPIRASHGVAHILEHSVLAGSRAFPVKDPFMQMANSSLATYLNAFTGPDWTTYPVASQNPQDFLNLMHVYLDAVFFPKLSIETFQREGWHLRSSSDDSRVTYGGIVFNEMKGTFATAHYHHYRGGLAALFPDTHYSFDSGGDPEHIPELTHKELVSFHRGYYHPSNARILMYGPGNFKEEFDLLERYLSQFTATTPPESNDDPPSITDPKVVTRRYPIGADAAVEKNGWISLQWAVGPLSNTQAIAELQTLSRILFHGEGAPLRKVLLASGLGDGVIGEFSGAIARGVFKVGIRGCSTEQKNVVEELVFKTLKNLAENGIDGSIVTAHLDAIEFESREEANGAHRGMSAMQAVMVPWTFGADPFETLRFDDQLQKIRNKLASNRRIFEDLIEQVFLKNPARVTFVLQPDKKLSSEWEEAENSKLQAIDAGLTPAQRVAIVAQTAALDSRATEKDPPEALATLPRLGRNDMSRKCLTTPTRISESPCILSHPLDAHGIVYQNLAFNLRTVALEDLPYARVLASLIFKTGTKTKPYDKFATEITGQTGGLNASVVVALVEGGDRFEGRMLIKGSAIEKRYSTLNDLVIAGLLEGRLDDRERIATIVREQRAGLEQGIVHAGNSVAGRRASAQLHPLYEIHDRFYGVHFLKFLRRLEIDIASNWSSVEEKLNAIRTSVISSVRLVADIAAEEKALSDVKSKLLPLIDRLPIVDAAEANWECLLTRQPEGFTIPSQVNYVAQSIGLLNSSKRSLPIPAGALEPIARYIAGEYLLEHIRFKGGAYGCGFSVDRYTGVMGFTSYRDPNIEKTLKVYDETSKWLADVAVDEDQIDRSIIAALARIDAPRSIETQADAGLIEYLLGATEAIRQSRRDELLAVTVDQLRRFAAAMDTGRTNSAISVLGGADALKSTNSIDLKIEALL